MTFSTYDELSRFVSALQKPRQELKSTEFCSAKMEQAGRTVASIVIWDCDDFGILVDYGHGEWRKYRVGTRDEALKELRRIGFEKRQDCWIGK